MSPTSPFRCGTGTATSGNYAVDTARPTATVVVADADLTGSETSLVTITFSEAVTGFNNADLTIANGTLTAVSSSDGGITWTATFTPTTTIKDTTNLIIAIVYMSRANNESAAKAKSGSSFFMGPTRYQPPPLAFRDNRA